MVAEKINAASAFQSGEKLENYRLEEMYFLISTSREKVDIDRLRASVSQKAKDRDSYGVVVAPRNPESGDYHVHFNWFIDKEEINFRVEYLSGPKEHESDEREPYAEQFMEWFGQFFKYANSQVHVHARFRYPRETRQSKFPLPLKTSLPGEPEIDGISLRLPSEPNGVSRVRLTQGKKSWFVEVIADQRLQFKEFDVYTEVRSFVSVLDTILEETKS